jgi:inorganic phosphate transporter, PiT family
MDITFVAVVLMALAFDFTNGFHDTANAIATSVSTKAVSPKVAVLGAAILNFLGAFVSLKVAATVAKGIVNSGVITLEIILAGILGAIIWNLTTWRFGMPTSSSHALVGGVAGSAIVAGGFGVINWGGVENKILIPSLVAPLLGIAVGAALMFLIFFAFRKRFTPKVNFIFKRLQLVSGSFVAFTHGTNDAQKTMGIIALALLAANPGSDFHVPLWVILSSATAMALGTYIGGWRIINTLGNRLVKLEPPQGFAAETTTATILAFTAHYGFPVSTTHTVSGSILGAGVAGGLAKVRGLVLRNILLAWVITIPCAALVGAFMEILTRLPLGSILACVVGGIVAAAILLTRHWTWESTAQVRSRLSFLRLVRKK